LLASRHSSSAPPAPYGPSAPFRSLSRGPG
jgi:hypothetical protein